jgi:hypothetical protein
MSCKSPSIERVVQRSKKAKEQIEILNNQIRELAEGSKGQFYQKIQEHSDLAKIADFRELIFNSATKTEYSHEFSLDKIAPVIARTLEAVAASLSGSALAVITSPKAIKSYSDLVLSITEAAKTKSSASNNLAFSSTRIAPGIYAFLSSNSLSIKDQETFGEESVTATSVLFSLRNSEDDLVHTTNFELAYLDAELLLKLKHIQIGFADDLAKGEMTIAVWFEKDAQINKAILDLQKRINSVKLKEIIANAKDDNVPVNAELFNVEPMRNILEESIVAFENRGSIYKAALDKSRALLSMPFV